MTPDEALARLRALGLTEEDAQALFAHFDGAERRGKAGHGYSRIPWLEEQDFDRAAEPRLVVSEDGYERWDGEGALGYLVLDAAVRAQLERPPARARLVVCSRAFPTGALGLWARRLAEGGLVGGAHRDLAGAGSRTRPAGRR